MLPDGEIGGMKYVFCLQISSWYKKDVMKGPRKYFFSCSTKEEMYNWVITLNFLRVKAIYDQFTKNFGLINLPLPHEIKKKTKHRMKIKFQSKQPVRTNNPKLMNSLYNSMARKSIINRSLISAEGAGGISREGSFIAPKNHHISSTDVANEEMESLQKIARAKELLSTVLAYAFPAFIGFMQDIVLNVDNVAMSDEKLINIPQHLKGLKALPISKASPNHVQAEK